MAIIDGGGANFTSVQIALTRLGADSVVTSDPECISKARHVILPGVGTAAYAMQKLKDKKLVDLIRNLSQPVLGICLGQQLLCDYSEEDNTECLKIIPLQVKKLKNIRIIPHMGWNNLDAIKDDVLLRDIKESDDFYFVHSFAPEPLAPYTLGICNYGIAFAAVIKKTNFYGVQFHPEKSGVVGMFILNNFLKIT